MKEKVRQQLSNIIRAIDINVDKRIFIYGKPYDAYSGVQLPEGFPVSWPIFQQGLEVLLYKEFYAKDPEAQYVSNGNASSDEKDAAFLKELRAANKSDEGLDKGWVLESHTPGGAVVINKGGFRRLAPPGEYLRAGIDADGIQRGENIWLYRKREYAGEDNGFYFVYGHTLLEHNPGQWVRLYFNLRHQGAPLLVRLLSTRLNKYQIPFTFKCLKKVGHYDRTDTGVLYFEKRYFHFLLTLIKPVLEKLHSYLNENTPLFTKKLHRGLGFAENPFDPKESFGTSRCKMIVEGIENTIKAGLPKQAWMESIEQAFASHSIDLAHPYLSPNSKFPYHFDSLKEPL